MLRHDLRRALLSPRTLLVALAYGVLLSLGATETWNDSAAYQFAFSYKTGFYILFYLCAVLPYGCGYLEDRLSGYWRFFQTRCSSTRYSVSKVLVTALSGALVVLAGSFLFVVILRLQYPADNDFRVDYSGYDAIISMGRPYLYFFVKSLLSAALGSAFAVVALYLSTFLRNMIATLAVPLVLYYTINELTVFGLIPDFLSPTVMMYRPPLSSLNMAGNVAYTLLLCLAVILLMGWLFDERVRKEFEHG